MMSVVIHKRCGKFAIRLQVSMLVVASVTAEFIESFFFFN